MNYRVKLFLRLFGLLLAVYFLLRFTFYLFNFQEASLTQLLAIFYWGFRIDFTILFILNFPFWLIILFAPLKTQATRKIIAWLFIILNLLFIALNVTDLVYFPFNLRRSTIDVFRVIKDSGSAWVSFIVHFWYAILIFILIAFALSRLTIRFFSRHYYVTGSRLKYFLSNLLVLAICIILARGLGSRPVLPTTPLLYLPSKFQPTASNSTYSFLYSLVRKQTILEEKKYFPADELDKIFTIRRQYVHTEKFQRRNVVIFILESFSWEFLDPSSARKAKTPFLDSIMSLSTLCTNAFANGLESNKGITAIIGSIPAFTDEPFYFSPYASDRIRGIGTILKEEGYETNFFMGASPDHFGFGKFCHLMGIDNYYSMREFGHNEYFDGTWGIYDHYFLPYVGEKLASKNNPFFSVIFNISSHDPFNLPDSLIKMFSIPGQNAQQNSISYVDYSLKLFFDRVKNSSWFKNTLFVFSADHALSWTVSHRSVLYKAFRIPIFFYQPSVPGQGKVSKTVQQLDIVPSILDMMHYGKPFMAFGNSINDTTSGFAVNKLFENIQLNDSSFIAGYDEMNEKLSYCYNYKEDTALVNNLLSKEESTCRENEKKIKAILQRFNESLAKDRLFIK